MSDTDGKVKTYKHPDRSKPAEYKPYVPQYQVHGKDPQEYQGAVAPGATVATPNADNPRLKRAPVRQPYADATNSPIGRGPVPNVGNNMEHTWAGVDGDLVDDLTDTQLDPNQPMIDNNEFMTDQALGFQSGPTAHDILPPSESGKVLLEFDDVINEQPLQSAIPEEVVEVITANQVDRYSKETADKDILYILQDLAEDAYLLIVSGTPVCSGPMEEIQDQARAMVFGEHEVCDGNPVSPDDIVILKRVKVKVGLFLE